ncbi:MAG: fatty acyl-AMP ligase [Acidobacteria bacterium]|nr:fatty acyl-AMP ligase [Acidobacteriota bacterium]
MLHSETLDSRLENFSSQTLVAAIEKIPRVPESHMRFIGFGAEERYFTYRQLYAEANRRAAHFAELGLQKGDRLALMMSEAHEFIMSFLGCVIAGIIPAPISPPMMAKGSEVLAPTAARIVDDSRAKAFLTTESTKSFAEQVLQRSTSETRLMIVESVFAGEPPPFNAPGVYPEDICFLQYTSGSTTLPRGVMVSHANLMANMRAFMGQRGMNPGPEDVGVTWLPLYHDMGLIGFILGPLVYVGPVIVLSTTSFARDPRIWLKAINKYRGTITYAPNFAYAQVVKRLRDSDLENLDLSCLRIAGCGAEPIQASTLRSFAERLAPTGFRPESFLPSYGMAEATLAISLHRPGTPVRTERVNAEALKHGKAVFETDSDVNSKEFVSCGFPLADHHLAIVNEDGELLPEREVGEIVFRGPSVTRGYFQNPEATAATWRDEWLHTGDLGYLADGELFVCGRVKELIIIRGANYYPQDIEWAVRDLPGIKRGNVVAFGVHENGNERLVILAESDARDLEQLRQAIRVKILESVGLETHRIVLVPSGTLTRTTSGKLQRRKMKQRFEQGEIAEL